MSSQGDPNFENDKLAYREYKYQHQTIEPDEATQRKIARLEAQLKNREDDLKESRSQVAELSQANFKLKEQLTHVEEA